MKSSVADLIGPVSFLLISFWLIFDCESIAIRMFNYQKRFGVTVIQPERIGLDS
jgi:hypothetical protein